MSRLLQASARCVGYQGIVHYPCSRVPSAMRLVIPEEVGVPIGVGLQVLG